MVLLEEEAYTHVSDRACGTRNKNNCVENKCTYGVTTALDFFSIHYTLHYVSAPTSKTPCSCLASLHACTVFYVGHLELCVDHSNLPLNTPSSMSSATDMDIITLTL